MQSRAQADDFDCATHPLDCKFTRPTGGKIVETTTHKLVTYTIVGTDKNGHDIGKPKTVTIENPGGGLAQSKPVVIGPVTPDGKVVEDIHQKTKVLKDSGEINDLMIEAVYKDPSTGDFVLGNVFGAIRDKFGLNVKVTIPDLYADTNHDGSIGDGDLLYSLVDLNVYMASLPSFSLGDSFSISHGVSSALPGMMFSTTPFVFSPTTGWTSDGSDLTTTGTAETEHGATAVPEPQVWTVLLAGLFGVGSLLRRRRQGTAIAR